MAWTVELQKRAMKDIAELSPELQRRVLIGIDRLRADPASAANVKRLVGREDFRLRVGDYRVFFILDADAERVILVSVEHRRDAYR